jgi:hypothetical protein
LEGSALDDDAAKKLVGFTPLSKNEDIKLDDSEACHSKVREFMRQIMQDSGEGWKAEAYLRKLKEHTAGFDYRIGYSNDGRPEAIVWITPTMRKSWIRYGATIFLDAMKRKMNSLHWPYIAPVGLDHEKRVVLLCECLCIAEELKKYAFVLKSLEEMEPRRKLKSIRLIYSDCFITDELLTMVGLRRPASMGGNEGTDLIWDSHHLRSQVWPSAEGLGQRLYDMVSEDLGLLLFGQTRAIYDEAYGRIAAKLASNPAKLEYIKTRYYDHPERFAQFYVKRIPGNLGKSSSQPAESNHSSVVAHLGPGSTQDIVMQITDLYSRQK